MNIQKSHVVIIALKIAVGASLAILIAELLGLSYATSAGTITLLTLMTTKRGSLRLAGRRLITFAFSMVVGLIVVRLVPLDWASFGVYMFCTAFLAYALGWSATLSVNAVIGTHLLLDAQPGAAEILNELILVLIGITIAIVLNLFDDYRHQRQSITQGMRTAEGQIQALLESLAGALETGELPPEADAQFDALQKVLREEQQAAYQYQDNTFESHPVYYIDYLEMRRAQCDCLLSIRNDIRRCPAVPARAGEVSQFLRRVIPGVTQWNDPKALLDELDGVFAQMRDDTPPETSEEFERRTALYHILLEMEQLLKLKQDFVLSRSEEEIRIYHKS